MVVTEITGERAFYCDAAPCRQERVHSVVWEVRALADGHESGRTPLWWKCNECGKESERED